MEIVSKKRQDRFKMYSMLFLFGILIVGFSRLVLAPPTPHNVEGRVFANGTNGVQNGIPVLINNTFSGDFVLVEVDAPPVPELRGSYSATISGDTGDTIVAAAWNSTHFGNATTSLLATTTNLDIQLNMTRFSEANVTILNPANNTPKNKTIIFNVTANVSMLGNNGFECNATISFSDASVLNVTYGENFTHVLGDIPLGGFKVVNWTVMGYNDGTANITVRAYCASDGRNFEKANIKHISNITIINLFPQINRMSLDNPVDLLAGNNLTLLCNITVFEANGLSDIKSVNATFYQKSAGSGAIDDNNDHYTNSSCSNTSSSSLESNFSCGFNVAYYANNGTWECNATVADYSNATNSSNTTTLINQLMAIDTSLALLDFGKLQATNTSPSDVNLTFRNYGNVPINISVRGYAPNESLAYLNLSMICEKGNISNSNERFSINNGTQFADMNGMNNETQLIRNITLQQRTDDTMFGNDTNYTFWKMQIPPLTVGLCNGTIVFGAVQAQ